MPGLEPPLVHSSSSVRLKRLLLVIGGGALSGLLLALALAPRDQWWLGPICLVPVLAAVRGQGLLRGFVGGIAVPTATSMTILYSPARGQEGGANWVLVGCWFFGFVIAIVSCVSSETKRTGWRRIAFLAALAVGLEFALFPILPAHLALTQYRMGGMLVLASIGGIWLVSLLLWTANIAFAEAFAGNRRAAYAVFAALCVTYALGFISHPDVDGMVRVAAVQTPSTDADTLGRLNGKSRADGALLAVWPEFSGMVMALYGDTKDLRELSAQSGQAPFVTTFRDGLTPLPHNTAEFFLDGKESQPYYKRKVLGGEIHMHRPGSAAVAVEWPGHPRVGLNICFDSCYPRMIGETAGEEGVGVIALPCIDPDSDDCFIAAVHAAFSPFRAAESGIPIVRADGNAYSSIVDNTGRIVAELGPRVEGVLVGDVSLRRRWTIYSVLGDWVLFLSIAWVVLEIGVGLKSRMRSTDGAQASVDESTL